MEKWRSIFSKLGIVLAICFGASNANAETVTFSWTGNGGYSLGGSFSFLETGVSHLNDVTASDLTAFQFTVSHGADAPLSFDLSTLDSAHFTVIFNYDATTNQFLTAGSPGLPGEMWNMNQSSLACGAIGFETGPRGSLLCNSSGFIMSSMSTNPLVVTGVTGGSSVPEPDSLVLAGSALLALGLARKRKLMG